MQARHLVSRAQDNMSEHHDWRVTSSMPARLYLPGVQSESAGNHLGVCVRTPPYNVGIPVTPIQRPVPQQGSRPNLLLNLVPLSFVEHRSQNQNPARRQNSLR